MDDLCCVHARSIYVVFTCAECKLGVFGIHLTCFPHQLAKQSCSFSKQESESKGYFAQLGNKLQISSSCGE